MAGALSGLKVVELGEMVSAPYAAKLMADMGAEVIKIERPGNGDGARSRGPFPGAETHPEKSGLYLYLNTNKLGVTLDVSRPEGFELLERLTADADVLIHNVAPADMDRIGLSFERLRNRNPRLVMTTISPWGLSGPKRDWRAEDLTLWSASGICYVNGGGPDHPRCRRSRPSASKPASRAECMRRWRRWARCSHRCATARGEHVEVSIFESLISGQMGAVFSSFWPYMERTAPRLGTEADSAARGDGMLRRRLYFRLLRRRASVSAISYALMGDPEWASEEIFADRLKRAANWDALKVFLEDWLKQ